MLFSQIYCYVLLINIFNLLKLLQLEEFALLRDCVKRRIYLDCFDFASTFEETLTSSQASASRKKENKSLEVS